MRDLDECLQCGSAGASPSRGRGAVLVLVMWLLLVLGLLLLGLNRSAQVAVSLAGSEVQRVQARWLARAGVEEALAVLATDGKDVDGTLDLWYSDPAVFENIELAEGYSFRVVAPPDELAEGTAVRFGIDDEASRLNLNGANFRRLTLIDNLTDLQADAILDWIDTNERSRPGGAERGYYQDLDLPYNIANGPLRTHRELLLVKGIEPADFFGEDTNANGILDRNENDGPETYPDDNADGILDRGLMGLTTVFSYDLNVDPMGEPRINLAEPDTAVLTARFQMTEALARAVAEKGGEDPDDLFEFVGVTGQAQSSGRSSDSRTRRGSSNNNAANSEQAAADPDAINEITLDWLAENWEYLTLTDETRLPGKLNVNTASRTVLETIPNVDRALADAIVNFRSTQGDLLSVGELYTRDLLDDDQFRAVAPYVTVRAHVFRVVSVGRTPSGITHTLAAVIDRGGDQPIIVDWREFE